MNPTYKVNLFLMTKHRARRENVLGCELKGNMFCILISICSFASKYKTDVIACTREDNYGQTKTILVQTEACICFVFSWRIFVLLEGTVCIS